MRYSQHPIYLWILIFLLGLLGSPTNATALERRGGLAPSPTVERSMTNGERLRRGLPLKAPMRRKLGEIYPRVDPSPLPKVTYTGYIELRKLNGDFFGYVSTPKPLGMLGNTQTIANAVRISFSLDAVIVSASGVEVSSLNLPGYPPLLGLVQPNEGDQKMAADSANNLVFNEINAPGTPPGGPPEYKSSSFSTQINSPRQAESSIWNVNVVTNQMSLSWINSDYTAPPTYTWAYSSFIYAGGNPSAWTTYNGVGGYVTQLTLHFIPTIF